MGELFRVLKDSTWQGTLLQEHCGLCLKHLQFVRGPSWKAQDCGIWKFLRPMDMSSLLCPVLFSHRFLYLNDSSLEQRGMTGGTGSRARSPHILPTMEVAA